MEKEKTIPTSDIYFTAFAALHKIYPQLENRNGHITFIFPGDKRFYEVYQMFLDNQTVSVAAFIAELKRLKSSMYAAKENGHGNL